VTRGVDRGLWRAGAVALALHVLMLGAAARWRAPASPPRLLRALEPLASHEVELDFGAPSPAAPFGTRLALRVQPRPSRGSAPALRGAELAPEAATEEPSVEPAPTATGTSDMPKPRAPSLDAIGLGTENPLLGRHSAPPPDTARGANRRVERVLADGLAEHDRELGLGADGPVLSALERATYASALPGNASALILARIDSSGRLALLDVLEADSDARAWSKVARRALGTLGRTKLRVPRGSKGMRLSIRVSSREVLPSGADPGVELRLFGVPLQKGRGKRSTRVSILEPYAKFDWVEVPTPGGESVKLPSLAAGIDVLGVRGDPSDIGAHPRRVVHAAVESQEVL
jgi:hypothetical protein